MNSTYPYDEDALNKILDDLEDNHVTYTAEVVDDYFICSRDYWDDLSPEEQADLMDRYPHLEGYFE